MNNRTTSPAAPPPARVFIGAMVHGNGTELPVVRSTATGLDYLFVTMTTAQIVARKLVANALAQPHLEGRPSAINPYGVTDWEEVTA